MSNDRTPPNHFVTSLLAHDISNYNQTSRGYLEMLLDEQMGPLTEEQARAVAICLRQSGRIQSLIEAVRLIDELADAPPCLEPVDLDAVIWRAIQRVQSAYADREIRVHFSPAGRRACAEEHLGEVMWHLLSNAVRHSEAEVVEVYIDAVRPAEAADAPWTIRVRDNGEGVPPARQPDLFSRLQSRSVHGSGVGLSLVRFLVERHGGRVWLEQPATGEGAVFALTVPCAPEEDHR